ncbi:MAG: hypothetical protein KF802_13965 [Bdellovibrionaceae bacterium]|nr:hypothetical protein [Pseudobdellovibrionaceae bacterium]MBX3033134.1 hypothetical protein [Pseudobdellovibrionaceae bacterium]
MLRGLALLILCLLSVGLPAEAQQYRRLVNFEWEPIEGAQIYELELQQTKKDGKTYAFKVKQAAWNGRLSPGEYNMRLRSIDSRGVAGEWGDPSPFQVNLESARLVSPEPKAAITAKGAQETDVTFRWEAVGGAENYLFELQTEDGSFKKQEDLKEPTITVRLPVAKNFSWKVTAAGADGARSEATSLGEFSLLGPKLGTPEFERPENEFVRDLKWSKPENTESFDVALTRFNPESKKWEKVQLIEDIRDNSLPFDAQWPGGRYKAQVKAKGQMRGTSSVGSVDFKVRGGSRTPAAEFTAEVRKSIDRVNGWYGIASYLVTQIQYASRDWDPVGGVQTSYKAVGGTGRVGLGYFRPETSWGFLGIADMSGFLNEENKNVTSVSGELNAVWRAPLGERGELRSPLGLYYKEHQVARGNAATQKVDSYENVTVVGPHVGAEYWYSFTPKIGFQVNAHLYMSLMKMKTPNGQSIEPTLSTQFGFLGSYRFNKRFTGLAGYARREDKVRYKSTTTDTQVSDPVNEATVQGDYLNFFAEYNF